MPSVQALCSTDVRAMVISDDIVDNVVISNFSCLHFKSVLLSDLSPSEMAYAGFTVFPFLFKVFFPLHFYHFHILVYSQLSSEVLQRRKMCWTKHL